MRLSNRKSRPISFETTWTSPSVRIISLNMTRWWLSRIMVVRSSRNAHVGNNHYTRPPSRVLDKLSSRIRRYVAFIGFWHTPARYATHAALTSSCTVITRDFALKMPTGQRVHVTACTVHASRCLRTRFRDKFIKDFPHCPEAAHGDLNLR